MSTSIVCPNCQHEFEATDAMRNEVEKELRNKMMDWQRKKEDDYKLRETSLQKQLLQKDEDNARQLEQERLKLTETIGAQLRRQLAGDYENQLTMLQQNVAENEEKLKLARQKELDFLRREQEIISKENELDLELQKMLLQERASLSETIRKEEMQKNAHRETEFQMKLKEMEMQLEAQRRLAEEMKRKAEQGSMQLQGEAQELILETMLRDQFPFDVIAEVGKGIRGADCVQTVRNNFGQECGKIVYESKRTQNFGPDWIEKLKADSRILGADIAVIVTQTMPKDMDCFGERDGVWICCFDEVRALANVLRSLIIKVHTAAKSQENKGDKMVLLYNYLTSQEFGQQWNAIREGFMSMRMSIQNERAQMEKMWKAREKHLEKIILNAAHISGSVEGIAGLENVNLNLTGEEHSFLLD